MNYGHACCGCDEAGCCTSCPLPKCKFETDGLSGAEIAVLKRNQRIKELREKGYTVAAVAHGLRVSTRTVLRASALETRPAAHPPFPCPACGGSDFEFPQVKGGVAYWTCTCSAVTGALL